MTMNCEQCLEHLDELLDGTLSAELSAMCRQHIEQCANCHEQFESAAALSRELNRLLVPPMRPAFPLEALAKVEQHHSKTHRQGFMAGFGSAIAASFALWFAVMLFSPQDDRGAAALTVSLNVGQVQKVNLVFNSPEQLEQATFTLRLPDNAEVDGFPGKRELTWTASLRKGKNRLSLPLRVSGPERGEIVATISDGKKEKVFHLKLDVKARTSGTDKFSQA